MPKVIRNIVTKGLSGKLGDDLVFRNRGGNTYVSLPAERTRREPSDKQKAQVQRFKLAIQFAKAQVADPQLKARYEAKAVDPVTAFNLAVADFLRPPSIEDVVVGGYSGAVGDRIAVQAVDNLEVVAVEVDIVDSGGNLVESGSAVLDTNGLNWVYTATQALANPAGGKVVVVAKDYPGNATETEVVLT